MNNMNYQLKESSLSYFTLTEMEEALIMGTLLGDAHIQKRKNSYRLKIEHSNIQSNYVSWKHTKLKRLCSTTKSPVIIKSKKGYETSLFYTTSGKWLEEIYHLFYKKKENGANPLEDRVRKTITPELIEKLPKMPILLAVFFMDDGSVRNDCYAGKIATQGFSLEENHLLCKYLEKWNIDCQVVAHNKSKGQYYITIPARSFGNLVQVIEPIVKEIPEMVYKLNYQCKPRND